MKASKTKKVSHKTIPKVFEDSEGYSSQTRCISIAYLDASQRDFQGKLTPKYAEVSSLLDIPEPTLKSWWAKREEIISTSDFALNELPRLTAMRLSVETNNIIDEFNRRGYRKLSARDLIQLFGMYVTKGRLLSGHSTANVAVQHGYTPVVPVKFAKVPHKNNIEPAIVQDEEDKTTQNT